MKTKITNRLLASLAAREKAYRVHDTAQPGLFIRVLPSGYASYMVTWARNKAVTLGRVGVMTLEQARTEAAQYLAEAHAHGEPLAVSQERKAGGMPTLEAFLSEHFEPWSQAHHRDAVNGSRAIRKSFADLLHLRLDAIDTRSVEQLRTTWIAGGLTPASANRNITRLRGVLTRAVEWGLLDAHPLAKLKRLKVDRRGRVRYLTSEEEKALRQAMEDREEAICSERDSANQWRAARNKELLPDLRKLDFSDHLKPLVITAMNTGMRRGEIFNLTWQDIDLKNKIITVEGATSKSGQTRHIPINKELLDTLIKWKNQINSKLYVFPGKDGKRLDNVKKSWEGLLKLAKIEEFRWHDLRHTFASKLVMAGVPLNTVRELLGHSDLSMTLRYAHLAPDSKASAVELL
ncbi:site-specific integrase [Stutzerimonas stutzeri]|uniref:site-specific integrase n=1 Tax=Stutzerimonas stutzeri TaxID=316 RepID=UPI000F7961E7|nr:site-specific integrase [Stutzerimonas stutzeri]MDH0609575.1 site-specific integrase [Stutzerimonas stutzeri]RRV84583.1 DUF4102 domain-containing protein [Stutzerimonas stutzeri]